MKVAAVDRWEMPERVKLRLLAYIARFQFDSDTKEDLFIVASEAVWRAATQRAIYENNTYLIKTGIGAIKHLLRDQIGLVRIPAHLSSNGEAAKYRIHFSHLEEGMEENDVMSDTQSSITPSRGACFEDKILDAIEQQEKLALIMHCSRQLRLSEQQVLRSLLAGKSIAQIARERNVKPHTIENHQSNIIAKLRDAILYRRKRNTRLTVIQLREIVRKVAQEEANGNTLVHIRAYKIGYQLGSCGNRSSATIMGTRCLMHLKKYSPELIIIRGHDSARRYYVNLEALEAIDSNSDVCASKRQTD